MNICEATSGSGQQRRRGKVLRGRIWWSHAVMCDKLRQIAWW